MIKKQIIKPITLLYKVLFFKTKKAIYKKSLFFYFSKNAKIHL